MVQAGCLFVGLVYAAVLVWLLVKVLKVAAGSIDLGGLVEVIKKVLKIP